MRTNVKRQLRATAGISVALTTAALSVVLASPANANETSPSPTVSPTASAEPTAGPTAEPTTDPTAGPTAEPTASPTTTPTAEPTASPDPEPTEPGEGDEVAVRGRVWNDKNQNGIQDTGEAGIANVPLVIFSGDEDEEEAAASSKAKGFTDRDGLTKKAPKASANADEDGEEGVVLSGADGRYEVKGIKLAKSGKVVVLLLPAVVDPDSGEFTSFWSVTKPNQGTNAAKDSDLYPTPLNDPEIPQLKQLGTLEFDAKAGSRVVVDAGLYQAVETATPTPTPGTGGGGPLPNTGLAIGGFLLAGAVLVGGGTALTIVARRRRQVVA